MTLRVMTYNVHRCVGVDRRLDLERIAAVIAAERPDVVALQELDVLRQRTGGVDQARQLAELLTMRAHFNAAMRVEEEEYGDAILTALPCRLVKAAPLPTDPGLKFLEPRGAVWVAVEVTTRTGPVEVQIINTHLGLAPKEQRIQADALLGPDWTGSAAFAGPAVLMGDFNATPLSSAYRKLAGQLRNAQDEVRTTAQPTFPSGFPILRIDHVFLKGDITVERMESPFDRRARAASDHLPLLAQLQVGID